MTESAKKPPLEPESIAQLHRQKARDRPAEPQTFIGSWVHIEIWTQVLFLAAFAGVTAAIWIFGGR